MYLIVLILTSFVLLGSEGKSGSYTSYVKQYEHRESACNSTCVAIRLGVGIGVSSLVVSSVCIPLTTWYCVYKCRQINFGYFKRRGREEGYELMNQRTEGTNFTEDSSSDLEGLDD